MLSGTDSTCCTGPTGRGIICGSEAECCGGICVIDGTGCSRKCKVGEVLCGGECLPSEGGTCCFSPETNGAICGTGDRCCADGSCVDESIGCASDLQANALAPNASATPPAAVLPAAVPPAMAGPVRAAATIAAAPASPAAQTQPQSCSPGTIWCGDGCLEGDSTSICCKKADGQGMLCGPSPDCCNGLAALGQMSKTDNVV